MKQIIFEASKIAHGRRVILSIWVIRFVIDHVSMIEGAIAKDIESFSVDEAVVKFANKYRSILFGNDPVPVGYFILVNENKNT